jgi:hypothetical protein
MNKSDIIKFCLDKETNSIARLDPKAIRESELRPQELHVQIKDGRFTILRKHDSQDTLRNNFLISLFSAREINLGGLDFEFIFNSGDDVTFYEEGVPRWCFTRRCHHPNLLVPNPHICSIDRITGAFPSTDSDFFTKKDEAIFAGSYTGGRLPTDNQRFLFCLKNRDSELGKFAITNFCVDTDLLKDFDWKSIESDYITPEEQLKYKYILNINGNTNCWDRLLWSMNSNSLCLFLRPKREDMCWYYHYFKTFGGFVYADETDWDESVRFFNKNPSTAEKLSKFQKKQSEPFNNLAAHLEYFGNFVEFYNKLYQV